MKKKKKKERERASLGGKQEHVVAVNRKREKNELPTTSETRPMCERGYVNNILENWNGILCENEQFSGRCEKK